MQIQKLLLYWIVKIVKYRLVPPTAFRYRQDNPNSQIYSSTFLTIKDIKNH